MQNKLIFMLIIVVVFPFKIFAQEIIPLEEPRKPVMESVFWNTFMGSIWGGVMGVAYVNSGNLESNEEEAIFTGITIGGVLGYGIGIFLVFQGITFDQRYMPANPIRQPSFQGGRIKPQSEYILGRMDQKKSLKNQIELTIFQIQF